MTGRDRRGDDGPGIPAGFNQFSSPPRPPSTGTDSIPPPPGSRRFGGVLAPAVLLMLGIVLVAVGFLDESSGDRDFPVMALGVVALIGGGLLEVWSRRQP